MVIRQRVRSWARGNGQNTVPLELIIIFCESCGRRKPALSAVLYRNVSGYLEKTMGKIVLGEEFYQTDVAGIRIHVILWKSAGFQRRRGSRDSSSQSCSLPFARTCPFLVDETIGDNDLLFFHHGNNLIEQKANIHDHFV